MYRALTSRKGPKRHHSAVKPAPARTAASTSTLVPVGVSPAASSYLLVPPNTTEQASSTHRWLCACSLVIVLVLVAVGVVVYLAESNTISLFGLGSSSSDVVNGTGNALVPVVGTGVSSSSLVVVGRQDGSTPSTP